MSDTTIAWTDMTWNPTRGCTRVSAGCERCYAENMAGRFSGSGKPYEGLVRKRAQLGWVWTGDVRIIPHMLDVPLRYSLPRRIFVNSMSDLFHERLTDGDPWFIRDVFRVMARCPQHTFQVLTKRPAGMYWWVQHECADGLTMEDGTVQDWPLPNVWLGTSIENQDVAAERIRWLSHIPAAVRFLSVEPLLGPVDLVPFLRWGCGMCGGERMDCPKCRGVAPNAVQWVIVGGESGPRARGCDIAWIRNIVWQCQAAHIAVFVKQLGAQPYYIARSGSAERLWLLTDAKGGNIEEFPEDLRIRQYPEQVT